MMPQHLRATRVTISVGLAVLIAAAAAIAVMTSRGAALEVHAAADPRAYVVDWLRSHSDGDCSDATDLTFYMPHTYALVDKLEAGDQWLGDGDGIYVGDISKASAHLPDAEMVWSGEEAWIFGADAKLGPLANHYVKLATPSGRSFWMKVGWERATAC